MANEPLPPSVDEEIESGSDPALDSERPHDFHPLGEMDNLLAMPMGIGNETPVVPSVAFELCEGYEGVTVPSVTGEPAAAAEGDLPPAEEPPVGKVDALTMIKSVVMPHPDSLQ